MVPKKLIDYNIEIENLNIKVALPCDASLSAAIQCDVLWDVARCVGMCVWVVCQCVSVSVCIWEWVTVSQRVVWSRTLYSHCTCTPGILRHRQTGLLFSKWHSLKLQQRGWIGCSICLDVNQSCDVRCDVQLSVSWPGPVLWPAWCAVWRCCNNIRPVSVRPQPHTHHHHALTPLSWSSQHLTDHVTRDL